MDNEYTMWFVSIIRDIFAYQYVSSVTSAQKAIIKEIVAFVLDHQEECTKKTYTKYHLKVIESGLSTLPNTQKAIDELGD